MAVLSLKQVADIDKRDLGINGRFYEDVEGYIYIGKGTRLFKFAKCSEVSVDLSSIPGASNVCEALNVLAGQISTINLSITSINASITDLEAAVTAIEAAIVIIDLELIDLDIRVTALEAGGSGVDKCFVTAMAVAL